MDHEVHKEHKGKSLTIFGTPLCSSCALRFNHLEYEMNISKTEKVF